MPWAAACDVRPHRSDRVVKVTDSGVVFRCMQQSLIGVVSMPEVPGPRGIVIVVGGPQYRIGSHRQFVLLARMLAAEGYPVLRFDYRGMGDSDGEAQPFDDIGDDIDAAVGALAAACPGLREVALWGLCDAASAVAMYLPRDDDRVRGVALLNPWVRSDDGYAKTRLKHYYLARLFSRGFWSTLFRGRLDWRRSASDLFEALSRSIRGGKDDAAAPGGTLPASHSFQSRMARGLRNFKRPALLILSGNDLTAREFADFASADPEWRWLGDCQTVCRRELPGADHTFSRTEWRRQVEQLTLTWLKSW
jgi:exosortase A-associated hydrolase 1